LQYYRDYKLHLPSVAMLLVSHLLQAYIFLDKNYLIHVFGWSLRQFLKLNQTCCPCFHPISFLVFWPSLPFPEILKIIDSTDGSQASDQLINKFSSEKPIFHSV
jgi:hypothetical protein